MKPFHMLYQPKFQNDNLVSIEALLRINKGDTELETYVKSYADPIELDRNVVSRVVSDISTIQDFNTYIPVSINVSYFSLTDEAFVDFCINRLQGLNVYLELTEHFHIKDIELLSHFVYKLRMNNIRISLDDFGKDFARSNLLVNIGFDQVKIDKSIIENITNSFSCFKHLIFLTEKINQFGISNIVYEGIESKQQIDLIHLFNDQPTIQGYLYGRPQPLETLVETHQDKIDKNVKSTSDNSQSENIEKLIYDLVLSGGDSKINEQIKNYDVAKLIYNKDPLRTICNFKSIYHASADRITLSSLKTIMDSSNRMLVIRNSEGIVIFENKRHRDFFGISTIGLDKDMLIDIFPDYSRCLDDDYTFMCSNEFFSIAKENFNQVPYIAMRQKSFFNDGCFILNSVSEEVDGKFDYRDPLTGCYMRDFLTTHTRNNIHLNKVVAYIDLDGFKLINDTHGHKKGDECLIDFVSLLNVNLRTEGLDDKIIRIGGDEFLILINSTDIMAIEKKIHSFRTRVERFFKAKGLTLSFSFGAALNVCHNIEQTIDNADKKMYQEKRKRKKLAQALRINVH